jgi:hypothetical protein
LIPRRIACNADIKKAAFSAATFPAAAPAGGKDNKGGGVADRRIAFDRRPSRALVADIAAASAHLRPTPRTHAFAGFAKSTQGVIQ